MSVYGLLNGQYETVRSWLPPLVRNLMPRRIRGYVSYSAGVLMGIISQALGIVDYKNLILILDLAIGLIGWGMSGFPMPRLMDIVLRPLQGILRFATTDVAMDSFDQGEILGQILGFVLFFFLLGGGILLARQAPRALPSTLRQILPRLKEFMQRADVIGRIKQIDVTPFVRDPQGALQDLVANVKRQLSSRPHPPNEDSGRPARVVWRLRRDPATGNYISPAGLIYGPDPLYENRVRRVIRQAPPSIATDSFAVFSLSRSEVLPLLDELWLLARTTILVINRRN